MMDILEIKTLKKVITTLDKLMYILIPFTISIMHFPILEHLPYGISQKKI